MTSGMSRPAAALQIRELTFGYDREPVVQLNTLQLEAGSSCAVLGPSGCGKSTLMHLIAGLLRPTRGSIHIAGQDLAALKTSALDRFRGQNLGIVFQRLHLQGALNVIDNLRMAQRFAGVADDPVSAQNLLECLDLGGLSRALPAQLSHGQAQRVAIARALVHRPRLLLADEPTASLDDGHAQQALNLLRTQSRAIGATLLVVTHDRRIRGRLDRELQLGTPS